MTGLSLPDLLVAVVERDWWRCVRCGILLASGPHSVHHRILGNRSNNEAWNLIALCGSGTTLCHGWVHGNKIAGYPAPSRRDVLDGGWIISRHSRDPHLVPVLYSQPGREGRYLLTADLGLDQAA